MPEVSFAVMAHPKREQFVDGLLSKLPKNTPIVWDEKDDRWDTGRRALLARHTDPLSDWHVVVQDDAILCKKFVAGVEAALANVPGNPVSFYAGKVRPHGTEVKLAMARAKANKRNWFSMSGPLWGVCLAIPTLHINPLIMAVDSSPTPNYDMRIAEYFHELNLPCWYSIPSLVNHRVGNGNPSLVNGRSAGEGRVAHEFIGRKDPTKISWDSGVMPWMDLSRRKWAMVREGYQCGACGWVSKRLHSMINHNFVNHELGKVDFIATSLQSAEVIENVLDGVRLEAQGELFVIGKGGIRPLQAKRVLSRYPRRFTVVDSHLALKYVGERRTWSMDNKAEING